MRSTSAEHWDDRYRRCGEHGTVGQRIDGPHEHYAQAMRIWETARDHMPGGGSVLDYGCGVGRFVPHVMSKYRRYYGVDLSGQPVSIARRRYECGEIIFGTDVHRIGVGHMNVYAVWCCTVLQHIVDDEQAGWTVSALCGCLIPGGVIALHENTEDRVEPDNDRVVFRYPDWYGEQLEANGLRAFISGEIEHHGERHTTWIGYNERNT